MPGQGIKSAGAGDKICPEWGEQSCRGGGMDLARRRVLKFAQSGCWSRLKFKTKDLDHFNFVYESYVIFVPVESCAYICLNINFAVDC